VQTITGSTLSTTVSGLTLGVQSTFQVQAGNSAGNWSLDGPMVTYVAVPADPVLIAPPVDRSIPTTVFDSTSFIYTGPDAVQIGVAPGTIAKARAAAIRGTIHLRTGEPVRGARVTVENHPEYGWTLSRDDGAFDLVVNGGGPLVLVLERDGFLPVQRLVAPGWSEYGVVGDVVMVPYDATVNLIDLSQMSVAQAAQGSVAQDANGARHATAIFPPGTSVTMTLQDGSTQSLSAMHVRATEYTVGPQGPAAMPLELPSTSAYTYAVAFTVDEAVAANARKVTFSQTIYGYVENFLGFPIGTPVPSGYHDPDKGIWVPEDDGKVVRILSVSTGRASIDIDGSGTAATDAQLAALGFSASELDKLAILYAPGQQLWRVPMTHFSARDWNYPPQPPLDGRPPNNTPKTATPVDCSHKKLSSIIECENQTLGEQLRLTGVPYTLNYRSDRVRGRRAAYQIHADIGDSGCWDEPILTNYVDPICGRARVWVRSWATVSTAGQPPQVFDGFSSGGVLNYEWDGRDRFGRELQGSQEATVKLCNTFPAAMYGIPLDGVTRSFAYTNSSGSISLPAARDGYAYDFCTTYKVRIGSLDVQPEGLGGWTLSPHHRYDYSGQTIYLGSGEKLTAPAIDALVVNAVAGGLTSGVSGPSCASGGFYTAQMTADGQPAYPSCNNGSLAMLQAPNGNLMFMGLDGVRQILPNGTLQTIIGVPPPPWFLQGDSGNEGPATAARFSALRGAIAMGPDGSIYIMTDGNFIRKVTPDGIIHAFAGTGQTGSSPDGVPALTAALNIRSAQPINGIVAAPDGSVYFSEPYGNKIRRVMPDGTLTTVAGDGSWSFGGDGGPATSAKLATPSGIALGPDGSLYIADRCNNRIRKVTSDGRIKTVAGSGATGCYPGYGIISYSGDGGPATIAGLQDPVSVAVARDGTIFFSDYSSRVIRRVRPNGNIDTIAGRWGGSGWTGKDTPARQMEIGAITHLSLGNDGALYASSETALGIIWKINSAYARTTIGDALVASSDGSQIYVFDGAGRHQRTMDALTGATTLTFGYEGAGRLVTITDSSGNITTIEHDSKGRPGAIVARFGQRTTLAIDGNGYLSQIANPASDTVLLQYRAPVVDVVHSGGLLTQLTDPRNGIHGFDYDSSGFLTSDVSPDGGAQTLDRHGFLQPDQVTHTTALGRATTYRVTAFASGTSETITVTDPAALTTTTQRSEGFTTSTTNPDGTTTTITDGPDPRFGMDAPISSDTVRMPSGLTSTITSSRAVTLSNPSDALSVSQIVESVNINGRTLQSTYNRSANTITTTTPMNRRTVTTLDALGRVTQIAAPGVLATSIHYDTRGRPDVISQGSRTTTLSYDSSTGLLAALQGPLPQTTTFGYDLAGRVTSSFLPDNGVLGASYDRSGNLTSLTPPGRFAHFFAYSPVDLESDYTPPAVDSSGTGHVGRTYNLDRQLTRSAPDGLPAVIPNYDSLKGRLQSIAFSAGTLSYAYNATTGQVSSITSPGGTQLSYTYDGALLKTMTWSGGPVTGTVTRTFDANFRVVSETAGGQKVSYGYDTDGLLTSAGALTLTRDAATGFITGTNLGSLTDTRTYNSYSEQQTYAVNSGTNALYSVDYGTRDALGRIVTKTEAILGETHQYLYGYDTVGRLTDITKDGAAAAHYDYDANGNRLAAPELTSPPLYDAQDRLLSYGVCSYGYKADGSLQAKTCPDGTTSYEYDSFGNLRHVTLPNGTNIDYVIDGQNRRIGKKVNGALVEGLIYRNQLQPSVWLNGDGSVRAAFVYGLSANVPEYMLQGGTTYRLITDQVGTVRLVVNTSTGIVAERIDYDEFGNVLSDSAAGFQPFGFAGGLRDSHSALTRYGARDYDPITGRWVAKDPVRFGGGLTNLYGYLDADPINGSDPAGLWVAGIGGSGAFHLVWGGFQVETYVVFDGHGNLGLYFLPSIRFGLDVNASLSPAGFLFPNMETINGLGGPSLGAGADFVIGSLGGGLSFEPNYCPGPGQPVEPSWDNLKFGINGTGPGLGFGLGVYGTAGYGFVVPLGHFSSGSHEPQCVIRNFSQIVCE